jgi:Ser/Thr protein kinase RdoA (MazF antagonist)
MKTQREQFTPGELAIVLSHYHLGVIESVKEFPRGSRTSAKLLIRAAGGRRYVLKRRAVGRDDPARVAFAHTLLDHLAQRGFPVPPLIRPHEQRDAVLRLAGRTYELFGYVEGHRYRGAPEETDQAGRTLHDWHVAVQTFHTNWQPPTGSFHDSPAVRHGLDAVPATLARRHSASKPPPELTDLAATLRRQYDAAARQVNACGYADWPQTIIHGDWHPGNMLFHHAKVAAVLDLDAVRRQPRATDVANGMLQFSILRGPDAPADWPACFDEHRMRLFLDGYRSKGALPEAQQAALLDLMIESLIAEAVMPIAATGSFGQLPGLGVLQMAGRKAQWLRAARFQPGDRLVE